MSRKLPSTVSLRAFEAAARHLSFTKAAQELHVTQSAVSHQVKSLEAKMGVRLFLRLTRQLRLTAAGETLAAVLRDSFDRIEETLSSLSQGSEGGGLRIGLTAYFAARWLTRRLSSFSALYPGIDLNLHLTNDEVDFSRMDVDLAIVWGHGDWPDLEAKLLVPTRVIAVCSPDYFRTAAPLRRVEDLRAHRLLHEIDSSLWRRWLELAGIGDLKPAANLIMDDPNLVHHAAIEGQGVALGAEALLHDTIAQGWLMQPFEERVELDGAYYLVYQPGARRRASVDAFCNWLMEQASFGDQPATGRVSMMEGLSEKD